MTASLTTLHRRLAAVLLATCLATPALAFDDPEDLPEGEGREDTFYLCSSCHSFQVVARQGMSAGMWADTFTLMIERHGMFDPGDEEREVIVNYLTGAYPPPERRGWQNPFTQN